MKKMRIFFSLSVVLCLVSCTNGENFSSEPMSEDAFDIALETTNAASERKLVKEGTISFETDDRQRTRTAIMKAVVKYKGYVSSDREYISNNSISTTIVARIPAKDFDRLLDESTKGVTSFDSKNVNIKDVTEEFLDVHARLKTKKELENRYLEIIKKASTVTELLEVERQLGQLRSEIESIEGRMTYLQNQVSLATLSFTFYETIPNKVQFGNKFKNGFVNGWDNLIWFFIGLINVWPFLILLFVVFFGLVWRKKRKAKNLKSKADV